MTEHDIEFLHWFEERVEHAGIFVSLSIDEATRVRQLTGRHLQPLGAYYAGIKSNAYALKDARAVVAALPWNQVLKAITQ